MTHNDRGTILIFKSQTQHEQKINKLKKILTNEANINENHRFKSKHMKSMTAIMQEICTSDPYEIISNRR